MDKMHPEIAAFAAIITGVIIHFSQRYGFAPTPENTAEIIVCVTWAVGRLAKKFFPD